jgi:hypothetical protein
LELISLRPALSLEKRKRSVETFISSRLLSAKQSIGYISVRQDDVEPESVGDRKQNKKKSIVHAILNH